MKYRLPIKLTVGVVSLFLLVISTCLTWNPLRYHWLKSQLLSEDGPTRIKSLIAIADDGKKAMPYLLRWLQCEDERLVILTCKIIGIMQGESWKTALPQLTQLISENPSKITNAVAAAIYKKGIANEFTVKNHSFLEWKYFSDNWIAKRNICIYILQHEDNGRKRELAAHELVKVGDAGAVTYLMAAITNDNNEKVRQVSAVALGSIGDIRSFEMLLALLKDNSFSDVHDSIAMGLARIADKRALDVLINAGLNRRSPRVRSQVMNALGCIRDPHSVEEILRILDNDNNAGVRQSAAIALACIDERSIDNALRNSSLTQPDNFGIKIALAWRNGGKCLDEILAKTDITDNPLGIRFHIAACAAHWGNSVALRELIMYYSSTSCNYLPQFSIILRQMPKGFPSFILSADKKKLNLLVRNIQKCFAEIEPNLVWNRKNREYRLISSQKRKK